MHIITFHEEAIQKDTTVILSKHFTHKLLMQQQEFVPQKCAGHMSEKESQRNDSSRA